MGVEIERKFLVNTALWHPQTPGTLYRQGYVSQVQNPTVRIRIAGNQGFITLKGQTQGTVRSEYEYAIPVEDAQEMLDQWCKPRMVEKVRYRVPIDHLVWEVDVFEGRNQGLVLAEVELDHPDVSINLPPWVGQEVSEDARYYNSNLAQHPYITWAEHKP
ncbi:MAG TPA: CYTH domain-containing protein [Stenomitos sp.]